MADEELLKRILETQQKILEKLEDQKKIIERIEKLENAVFTQKNFCKTNKSILNEEDNVIPSEFNERIQDIFMERNIITRMNKARELLEEIDNFEIENVDNLTESQKRKIMDFYRGIVHNLSQIGINTTNLPFDFFTQTELLQEIDHELERLKQEAARCPSVEKAKSIVQSLKQLIDTMDYNKRRFTNPKIIEEKIKNAQSILRYISKRFDIVIYYYPTMRRNRESQIPKRLKDDKKEYTGYDPIKRLRQDIDRIHKMIDRGATKNIVLAEYEDLKRKIESLRPYQIKIINRDIHKLEKRIDKLEEDTRLDYINSVR